MLKLLTPIRLKRKWTATQWTRLAVQLLFLALTAGAIIRHRINEAAGLAGPEIGAPSVDALSPMGGLETLWTWMSTGTLLRHLHMSDLILLGAAVLLVFLLGPAFCGWICPFGTLQEWLYRLRTRLIPWKITVPAKLDRLLRYGRYLVLGLVLLATYSAGEFIFGDYCPWKAVWDIGGTELAIGGGVVLGLVVVSGLLVERAWCRYACPLGAFLGIFNKLTPVRLRRKVAACTSCHLCNRTCPMDLEIAAVDVVTDTTCNRCLLCVDSCPRPEALEVKAGRRSLRGWLYGALAAGIFGGAILLSMVTGTWEAYASDRAVLIDEASGALSTEEIRGWRSLRQVIDLWGIPQDVLYREMGLDADVSTSTLLKELEARVNAQGVPVDTTFVRELVGRWQRGEVR